MLRRRLNKPGAAGVEGVSGQSVEPDDRQLIRRAQGGEQAAFEALVRRYRQPAYRAAYALVGNVEDAMDVTQEAFMRAYRALGRFELGRPFFPWFYRIVRNLGLSCLKQRGRGGFVLSLDQPGVNERPLVEVADRGPTPREQCSREELERHLRAALESLKAEDREIVVLRDIQGCSYKEIAVLLEIPIGTVMSRLYYARDRLRKKMAPFL